MTSHADALRARIRTLENPLRAPARTPVFSGGKLGDAIRAGCAHELGGPAAGLFAVMILAQGKGPVLWCLGERSPSAPYAPALAQAGLDPARLALARLWRTEDLMNAAQEGLRAGWHVVLETPKVADLVQSRRLQLAAEAGGGIGLVLASGRDGGKPLLPSAATRWRAAHADGALWPAALRLDLRLVRHRGGLPGQWTLEWTHASRIVSVVSPAARQPDRTPRSALA